MFSIGVFHMIRVVCWSSGGGAGGVTEITNPHVHNQPARHATNTEDELKKCEKILKKY